MSRPYESLLAKGEDRRQHVLEVALRMMATGGGRATTLGQVARAAGVSTAGLLHHFSSKEQATVGALRASVEGHDVSVQSRSHRILQPEEKLEAYRSRARAVMSGTTPTR